MTDCTCELTDGGMCPKFGRMMSSRMWELCKTRPDYHAKFAEKAGKPGRRWKPCKHRGEKIEQTNCNCVRYACPVQGECTLFKRFDEVMDCQSCEHYERTT